MKDDSEKNSDSSGLDLPIGTAISNRPGLGVDSTDAIVAGLASLREKWKWTTSPPWEGLRLKPWETGFTVSFSDPNSSFAKNAITERPMRPRFKGFVHPTAVVYPGVEIGENVYIGAFCVIGGKPESFEYFGDRPHRSVRIGNNVWLGNHVTVDSGTTGDTLIENDVTILCHSHVGHDSKICDRSFISASCTLGGHTTLKADASMGLRAVTKPRVILWEKAMLGMNSAAMKNIPMGEIHVGSPAVFLKKNTRKL